jgi:hypothetical protein
MAQPARLSVMARFKALSAFVRTRDASESWSMNEVAEARDAWKRASSVEAGRPNLSKDVVCQTAGDEPSGYEQAELPQSDPPLAL